MKTKKRRKSSRFRGSHTHGRGGKKKARGSGHRGGKGMAGTGKRGDQKKTLILNLPYDYFGKDKIMRRKQRIKLEAINIQQIINNLPSLMKFGKAKESKDEIQINLKGCKILGEGESSKKLKITASAASKSAIEKIKKSGGEVIIENRIKPQVLKT